MLMKYVFTVIATSWLRYSRQLEWMLLSVIARSVMLLRDESFSGHNISFEDTYLLVIFPVRSVRKQKTRRYLSWFHNNELPKYVRTTPEISLITYSRAHSKFGPMEQKTLDILERIFIIKAGWLHNIVCGISFKTLMLYYLHWRSCFCKCPRISAFDATANAILVLI